MLKLRSICYAATLAVILPISAHAATTANVTHVYGSKSSSGDSATLGGNDLLKGNRIDIFDTSSPVFNDVFDFSGAGISDVSTLQLVLGIGTFTTGSEAWAVRISSGSFSADLDLRSDKVSRDADARESTYNIDTALSRDLFASILTTQVFSFGFVEKTSTVHDFKLFSAKLNITGEEPGQLIQEPSPVPLPASGLLLLGGLLGVGALRRRRKVV